MPANADTVIFGNGYPLGDNFGANWGPISTSVVYGGGSTCTASATYTGATCTPSSPFRSWYGYPSTFPKPLDITTDDRGYVYVSEQNAAAVAVFNQDLDVVVQSIPTLANPHGVSLIKVGAVYWLYVSAASGEFVVFFSFSFSSKKVRETKREKRRTKKQKEAFLPFPTFLSQFEKKKK